MKVCLCKGVCTLVVVSAFTVAVRVQLYSMASSPNNIPGPMRLPFFVTSTLPLAITYISVPTAPSLHTNCPSLNSCENMQSMIS